jgi:hypothetical protein
LLLLRIFRGLLFKPWNDRLFKHHNTQVHIGTQKHKIRKQYTRLAKEKKIKLYPLNQHKHIDVKTAQNGN